MSRHTRTITIEDEGRDQAKVFILTEMPATAAEKWATQAIYLLTQAGVPVSDEARAAGGMQALAATPLNGIGQLRALQDPSLDAWWDCVKYLHKPNHPPQPIHQGAMCQIEEIKTIAFLRMEVLRLHTDFFSRENASTSESPSPAQIHTGSSPTRISRPRSAP
jgi:hypothetical protein